MENMNINEFVQDLCAHMGMSNCQITVNELEDAIEVQIEVPESESGMLIGYHGETISSMQLLINSVFYKKDENQKKIIVNVNDYREKRNEVLLSMAQKYAQRAIETGRPQVLPFLPSSERLVIHVELKEHPEVMTESEGEGISRRLIVKLKE